MSIRTSEETKFSLTRNEVPIVASSFDKLQSNEDARKFRFLDHLDK
jgi:hypothetical protein